MALAPNQLLLIDQDDYHLLRQLQEREPAQLPSQARLTLGQHLSDAVAATVGSWQFIHLKLHALFLLRASISRTMMI